MYIGIYRYVLVVKRLVEQSHSITIPEYKLYEGKVGRNP